MNTPIKKTVSWLGLSALMMIFWIVGLFIGNALFPSNLMDTPTDSNANSELILFIICALNTAVILVYIHNSSLKGLKLAGSIFLISFSIQYAMSQIETLWFNDSLKMPVNLIWAVVTGGAISHLLFAFAATWISGNLKTQQTYNQQIERSEFSLLFQRIAILAVVVWPIVYFMAGYLIAWQFSEVRNYYSGTTEMESFLSIMKGNFLSGLYFFQILRGVLWVLIALLVLGTTKGSSLQKGIILGLLLSILGCSQLLLPNPIMPDMVRIPHLIETSTSSFLWGIILSWSLTKYYSTHQKVAFI